jgi:Trk K+ transport system NAD-binding subunit
MSKRFSLYNLLKNHYYKRKVFFYTELLIIQIVAYTLLLYYAIPILENQRLTIAESTLFVIQTMTTVGYDLVTFFPVENQITVLILIFIMATGVFTVLMIIPAAIAPYLQDILQPVPPSAITGKISGHVIIVGHNEITKSVVDGIIMSGLPVVLLECDKNKALDAMNRYKKSVRVILGEYNRHNTWKSAHAADASHIIISTDEKTAATTILGMREMTEAKITAIIDFLEYKRYLIYAGADYVISPKNYLGNIFSRHASNTPVIDIIYETSRREGTTISIREENPLKLVYIPVIESCFALGHTIDELNLFSRYGVYPVFLWKKGMFYAFSGEDVPLERSDALVVAGREESIQRLLDEEFVCSFHPEKYAIIAGYGDVGKIIYKNLNSSGVNAVVIDRDIEEDFGIQGNAENESILLTANIEKADVLIAAVNDDEANIFTTLLARNMNPKIHILARANHPESVDKLYRAGADYVALLPAMGGQFAADIVIKNRVSVLIDLPGGQRVVMKKREGRRRYTVGRVKKLTGTKIIGIEGENHSVVRPDENEEIYTGDSVIAFGSSVSLKKLMNILESD